MKDERLKRTHKPDWAELGRVFPLEPDDFDIDRLSPDGGHHVTEGPDGETVSTLVPASHPSLAGKVPAPTPHIILQDQHPDGEKDILHVELTDAEWEKIQAAYEQGKLDPDGNGTNRYMSTLSLTDLGLARIDKMLGQGRHSGSRETVIV